MLFTIRELSQLFPHSFGNFKGQLVIEEVSTDSRKKTSQSLFVPLIGDHFDGHDYVIEAYQNGAIACIWDKQKEIPTDLPKDFPVFLVEDTTKGLQDLARYYREKVNPIVIGITGSNGKTTTKDIVASMTSSTYRTHHTKGNLNNHIGLPLTILSMDPTTEVLVVEMGMNHFHEIELLSKIAEPDYGIITNIGESHLANLGSREGIAKAKLEILQGLKKNGLLVIDGDEPLLASLHGKKYVKTCGFVETNDAIIQQVAIDKQQTHFTIKNLGSFSVPLLGKHHAKNCAYAIVLGQLLNISLDKIQQSLSSLSLTAMRFEMLTGKNNVTIINDAYNASPTSMRAAIDIVKQLGGFKEKVLVLGDIFELGEQSKQLHQSIAQVISPPITALFTLGSDMKYLHEVVHKKDPNIDCQHFTSGEALLDHLSMYLNPDTLLLFKASRGMQFELLVEAIK